jgi:hypothetical protein
MKRFLCLLVPLLGFLALAGAEVNAQKIETASLPRITTLLPAEFKAAALGAQKPDAKKHARGYKLPPLEVSKARHKLSNSVHAKKLARLPKATEDSWDSDALGYVNDMEDQNGCGDCYLWSGTDVVANAYRKAGNKTLGQLSVQYSLDYHPEFGGCGGGDEWEVTSFIMQHGVPSLKDYPGAGTSPGNQQPVAGLTMWKCASMGYCDPNAQANGVASTQSMKDCIKAYGTISIAIAAGSWSDPGMTVMVGPNDGIDHAVQLTGWKTGANGKTIFKMRNQWSTNWGFGGYAWIEEGSYGMGTEAYFVTVDAPPPPPGKAPYKLFEGTMAAPVPVGVAAGYPDLPSAEADGKAIANKDKAAVMVHDATDAMVETIQPDGPPPPPGTTFTFTVPSYSFVVPGGTYRIGPVRSITIPSTTVVVPAQTGTGMLPAPIPVPPAPMKGR